MMAATLAKGRTIIEMAACEPEVADLARCLNAMGAKISGIGSPRLTIDGVKQLHPVKYTVIPDRIEAGTFMVAAAITSGMLKLDQCNLDDMMAVVDRLRNVGVTVEKSNGGCVVTRNGKLKPADITTQPYPRISNRFAGSTYGAAIACGWQQHHHGKNLSRPLYARCGNQPHGRRSAKGRLYRYCGRCRGNLWQRR